MYAFELTERLPWQYAAAYGRGATLSHEKQSLSRGGSGLVNAQDISVAAVALTLGCLVLRPRSSRVCRGLVGLPLSWSVR